MLGDMAVSRPKSWPPQRTPSSASPYLNDDVSSASSIGTVSDNEPSDIEEPSPISDREELGQLRSKGKGRAGSNTNHKILPAEILET